MQLSARLRTESDNILGPIYAPARYSAITILMEGIGGRGPQSAPELQDFRHEVLRCVADRTLCTEFLRVVAQRPDEVCLRRPDGADWRFYFWADYAERVGLIAAGLRRLGLARG